MGTIEHAVFRECLKFCKLEKDIELHNVADLPAFTGLGSSSTFTVSLLHALHAFQGRFINPYDLARQAITIERHVLKENVGCQDQVMASFGGFNLVEFHTEEDFQVKPLPLKPERLAEFEQHLFLVFTGIKRKASDVVAHQLKRVNENLPVLRSMREMVYQGFDILTGTRPLQEFGELLHRAWEAKRTLDGGVSNPEIDALYQRGLEVGAWGGKLLGAGGGGFLLFFAPPPVHPRLAEVFAERQLLPVKLNAPGSQIIFRELMNTTQDRFKEFKRLQYRPNAKSPTTRPITWCRGDAAGQQPQPAVQPEALRPDGAAGSSAVDHGHGLFRRRLCEGLSG